MKTNFTDWKYFVYSLQEINAQPQSVVKGLFKDDPWTAKFKELLVERDYVGIKSEQMQGLLLNVFAKREHLLHLREVESEYTRTGLGGIWVCGFDEFWTVAKLRRSLDVLMHEMFVFAGE